MQLIDLGWSFMAESKVTPIIYHKTLSVTTNTNGIFDLTNANMGMIPTEYVPIAFVPRGDSAHDSLYVNCGLYRGFTDYSYTCQVIEMESRAKVTSTSLSITVYYIRI
jgi:hypothetical protein